MGAGSHDDAFRYYNGRPPYSPKMATRLARALKFDSETRLLEIACGNGALTQVIVPHVGHVTGLDVSKGMLSVAFRDRRIRYIEWDFNRQPPYAEERRFNHVIVGRALHWLSFQRLSETFTQSVEPGGALVVCASRFETTDWYVSFRRLLQNYGRLGMNPGVKALQALPSIGFRRLGTIAERFSVKLSPDLLLLHALSFQPVTASIEANMSEFKAQLATLVRPLLVDGVVTATCLTTAHGFSR